MENNCGKWKLTAVYPQEKSTRGSIWRSGMRSTMRAASQLPGRGSIDVDDVPALAHKSKFQL